MIPNKLKPGDEIRVVAPSKSLQRVPQQIFDSALKNLTKEGFVITFSKNSREIDSFKSSSIHSRIEDLHDAFSDTNVKAILTALGGFNSNQLLEYIDYSLIKENPKILCGYSDITVLLNAIYTQTGLVTYHGTHFSSFGFEEHLSYTLDYFRKCLMEPEIFSVNPSYQAQNYEIIQPGVCEGTIIGGNLCSINLLQGTRHLPVISDAVLFLEDDNIMGDYFIFEFDRNLESLIQSIGPSNIKGIVFGRFEDSCKLTSNVIRKIVANKKQLANIPVLFNVDFGHVEPFATFPIGGKVSIDACQASPKIRILEH
ncbi:MAG TPA: LD-carboxypeptidase [Candidatus Pelethocola excrementipullorum]|nr:LD-carboxypeptidase [Candidatus Pelethocola excrementipullorum]